MSYKCYKCQHELDYSPLVGISRSDTCSKCASDIRCCKNCSFYDEGAYNECHEPQAERQVDKERANFCDYFSLGQAAGASGRQDVKASALKKLDDLFK